MADEAITLEALEREAEEALKAEETPPSVEPEEAAEGKAVEASAETVTEESASSEQAEHGGKKLVEVPVQKLAKLREQRREAREEQEKLRKQNEELQRLLSLSGGQKPVEQAQIVPTLESCDYDEGKYAQAIATWQQQNLERQLQELENKRQAKARQQAIQEQLAASVHEHYQRVVKLGISEDDFIPAEQTLRDTFGDVAVEQLIDAIGEGSERVIYHLGLNQEERRKLEQLVVQDPSGLKAVAYATKLAAKLAAEPQVKKISQAPEPDKALQGGNTQSGSAILKRLKQLDGMSNRDQFRDYKRKLVAAGHTELLRQHGYI